MDERALNYTWAKATPRILAAVKDCSASVRSVDAGATEWSLDSMAANLPQKAYSLAACLYTARAAFGVPASCLA